MYTLVRKVDWTKLTKEVRMRTADCTAFVTIEVSNFKDNTAPAMIFVSGFVAPVDGKCRHFSQFFWGNMREGWKAFKGYQELIGGDFCDE